MTRVAIVTMSRDLTYGGNLQAYALQRTVNEITDFECIQIARQDSRHKVFVSIKCFRNLLTNVNRLVHYLQYKNKLKLFERFQSKYIRFTEKVYYDNCIYADELNDEFDLFISGSDQVWNCLNGINSILFLKFVDNDRKRVSYAASIGIENIPEKYKDEFKKCIQKYDYISVREEQAVEIVKDVCNREAELVLDPVFLRDKEEWDEIAGEPIIKNKYIFVYATQVSKTLITAIEECRNKTGYKVISIHRINKYKYIDFKCGPTEFINYIKNAEYIITSSFHCVAFSLIYGKKFTVIPHSTTGSRVVSILKILGASNCIYNGVFQTDILYDYDHVQTEVLRWKDKSLDYLKNALLETKR